MGPYWRTAGIDEAKAVMAKMGAIPVNDSSQKGKLREDGRLLHDCTSCR
jgi:hypothetical protein